MMVVAHNLLAANADRNLKVNGINKSKSMEKLSSGYRINRSADDAAGLAISEKMRWQIRGLDKAANNIMDGVSFVQTAEGYLNEVTSMLQRMNELSVQASNDTNTPQDREQLDLEIQQLKAETKRIFKTADYNTKKIWQVPYTPEPEIMAEGTEILLEQKSTSLPDGVLADPLSMEKEHMANTYTKDGTVYNAATYIDFSNLNVNDLSRMDGKGFYSTCCTCDAHYSIEFDSSTSQHSSNEDSALEHYTYKVGVAGCTSAADVVSRIVAATNGTPNNHFTNYEVSNTDPTGRTLVIYDNRPRQTANGDYGLFGTGVTYEEVKTYSAQDFQVFNRGVDADGNPLYGGVEVNDVRHTWEEMGITLDSDGKTFTQNQQVEFYDYTGERLSFKVNAGDQAPYISRNYEWDARSDGIYINNVMAASWKTLGINNDNNGGEYSFAFHNMKIDFSVPTGDTKEDVIDGINAKVLDKKVSWDLIVGETDVDTAVTISDTATLTATENNKDIFDKDYFIVANQEGISLKDSSGKTHTFTKWSDFKNTLAPADPEYPISDWGISDSDNKGTHSDNITFDDTANYKYTDKLGGNGELPVTFSFQLSDEAGLATIIQELNGARFTNTVNAPHKVSAAVNTGSSGVSAYVKNDYMDYATQRSYGRDFNDAAYAMSGSVKGTYVKGALTSTKTADEYIYGNPTDSTHTSSSPQNVYYISDGNGGYNMVNKTTDTWDRTYLKDYVTTNIYNSHYHYSNGNFAGRNIADSEGKNFDTTEIIREKQSRIETFEKDAYAIDTSQSFTEEQVTAAGGVIITQEQMQALDRNERSAVKQDWKTDDPTANRISRSTEERMEEFQVITSSGHAMTLGLHYSKNMMSDMETSMNFKATGLATRKFDVAPKGFNNHSIDGVTTDVAVIAPPRELNIQSGAQAWQGIKLKWEGLNNTILGINTMHVRDYKHAQKAMGQVAQALQIVTTQRAEWGAQQNRLERAYNIDNNVSENTSAAESRIRDTDMAKEMVVLSKHNILEQAGSSVLAQANQSTEGTLRILA